MKAILTFHSIDDSGSILSYPVSMFRELVFALLEKSTPIISLAELRSATDGVVLSFDDGMASVRENALPVLSEANVPAHIFLTTGAVGADNDCPTQPANAKRYSMLNWSDIDACTKGGMLIESHTHTHPYLTQCSNQKILDECATADSIIERRTGRRPTAFAYPYGDYDARVADLVKSNYECAVTTTLNFLNRSDDRHLMPRLDTFYIQRRWQIRNTSGSRMRLYIKFRGLLRRLRGSR
jgi:peptidoglycan/xylan/chitin deacetylase (PgdA/CDA1 family)